MNKTIGIAAYGIAVSLHISVGRLPKKLGYAYDE